MGGDLFVPERWFPSAPGHWTPGSFGGWQVEGPPKRYSVKTSIETLVPCGLTLFSFCWVVVHLEIAAECHFANLIFPLTDFIIMEVFSDNSFSRGLS